MSQEMCFDEWYHYATLQVESKMGILMDVDCINLFSTYYELGMTISKAIDTHYSNSEEVK